MHELSIINNGNGDGTPAYLGVDYLMWESELREDSSTLNVDDADLSHFSYLPGPSWWSHTTQASGAFNQTLSTSVSSDAQARLTFRGESVTLYGAVGPNDGNYTCTLDGGAAQMHSATNLGSFAEQTLCFFDGLSSDEHNLVVQLVPTDPLSTFSIDYAQVQAPPASKTGATGSVSSGASKS